MNYLYRLNYKTVITQVSRQLKTISFELAVFRVNISVPTVAEIISLLMKEKGDKHGAEFEKCNSVQRTEWASLVNSLELALDDPLNDKNMVSYYLGQLAVLLEILASRNKKSMLVRLFD